MEGRAENVIRKTIPAGEMLAELRQISIFRGFKDEDAGCLGAVEVIDAPPGVVLLAPGDTPPCFWVVLSGAVRATKQEPCGGSTLLGTVKAGDTFGEVPLLTGMPSTSVHVETVAPSRLIRIDTPSFWRLMSTCPVVRAGALSNMSRRLEAYRVITLHREKLISLGTLAAGLMHELNNPGTAARRATAQLRENLVQLQQISLRLTEAKLNAEQLGCLAGLQAEALKPRRPQTLGSLEQSDAEEALAEWLESIGVANAWALAPTLVELDWRRGDLECARRAFPSDALPDALNWLTALLSSLQLVATIEESITRVTDLVIAVKKYAYDNKNREREIDIHDSLESTLTILAHKFRQKQLTIHKDFSAGMPVIKTTGAGLSQVWTNLLDNAIDASPEKGNISIRTWVEGNRACVGIADEGPGIAAENQPRIFEPFFTTKPVGVGTGLGLDIAHRIVVGQFGGEITFESRPGRTEFVARVPA